MGNGISPERAKEILDMGVRYELRDHAFGDREITWSYVSECGEFTYEVGDGYSGGGRSYVSVYDPPIRMKNIGDGNCQYIEGDPPREPSFEAEGYADTREFFRCGKDRSIERNDSAGPDAYAEGATMPGLTRAGVLKELTGQP